MIRVVSDMGQCLALWLLCCVPGCVFLVFGRRVSHCRRLVVRMAPVAVCYLPYLLLVQWTQRASVVAVAGRHALDVVGFEKYLHIWVEPFVSRYQLAGSTGYYDWMQVVVVVGLLTVLAVREGDVFWRCARNSLAFIGLGGFLVFWLYPVAPPWILPASYGVHSAGLHNLVGVGDLMGAMPSLHTAWAAWACLVLWAILPGRWWLWGLGNMLLTCYVVVATGNHYVVDVLAGEALAAVAMWLANWWESYRHGPVEAERMAVLV